MLSFSELEFKWSVHVIDVLINYMLIFLLFPMICLYRGSKKCQKLAILPQIWLMHNEISSYIAMHSTIQMKLHI